METLKQIGYSESLTAANDNGNIIKLADRRINNTKGEVKDRAKIVLTPNLGLTDKEFKQILALGRR